MDQISFLLQIGLEICAYLLGSPICLTGLVNIDKYCISTNPYRECVHQINQGQAAALGKAPQLLLHNCCHGNAKLSARPVQIKVNHMACCVD